eukprot:358882-Chlamydomonas_euryale.AAC.4
MCGGGREGIRTLVGQSETLKETLCSVSWKLIINLANAACSMHHALLSLVGSGSQQKGFCAVISCLCCSAGLHRVPGSGTGGLGKHGTHLAHLSDQLQVDVRNLCHGADQPSMA